MPTYEAKLSTAITIPFGPVLDSTGAEFTTLVVGEVKISKNNGTPAALNGSATLTHKEVGIYELVLTASDISAVGQATLTCSKTTYVAPPVSLIVRPATVYDALITNATTAAGGLADVQRINGVSASAVTTIKAVQGLAVDGVITTLTNLPAITAGWLTAAGIASSAFTAAKFAADAIDSNALAASAVTEIWASVADSSGVTTLLSRLSSTRAGYLDNLSAGAVAQAGTALSTAQWTNTLATNLGTLAGHDPGATLGTSTLTQSQVSGGAYALNSASFAFNSALDFTTSQKAATLARVTLTDTATNLTNLPTMPTDWLTSTGLAASAVTEIWASVTDSSGVTTLLSRLTATRAGYLDNLSAGTVPTAAQNASALLATAVESGVTLNQCIRAISAAAAGKRSSSGTNTEQFDAIGNPGTARIVPNADAAGDGTPTLSL